MKLRDRGAEDNWKMRTRQPFILAKFGIILLTGRRPGGIMASIVACCVLSLN